MVTESLTQLERDASQATRELAAFLTRTGFSDLPSSAVQRAAWIVADTLGVTLRGSVEPEAERLYVRVHEDATGRGQTSVVFRPGLPRADAESAAFLNAVATCFLELDEGSRPTGHPSLHVLPSSLSLAQALHKSGQEFLTAFVLGYETQGRIQKACRLRTPVHPHGNFGHVGAVVALGKLSGWDEDMMFQGILNATALVMATSWQPCLAGGTVRNTYPGLTARTAFTVRQLVECGFTGYEGALRETFGEILGTDFQPSSLTEGLGKSFAVEENYFKFHAACALTHPVLDAVAAAIGSGATSGAYPPFKFGKLQPRDVSSIKVWVLERSLRLNVLAQPNQLSAKFSIPYAVAACLASGNSAMATFRDEWLSHPDVLALQQKVEVYGDPAYTEQWPACHPARVEITLADGQVLHGACANPFGSVTQEAEEADLRAKFHALTNGLLSKEQRETVWGQAMRLAEVADMAAFPLGKPTASY